MNDLSNGAFKNTRRHIMCHPQDLKKNTFNASINVVEHYPSKPRVGTKSNPLKLVCYSLWGSRDIYHQGAYANAVLIPKIYGNSWQVRVYVSSTIPKRVIKRLLNLDAQVFVMNTSCNEAGSLGAFWRFLPLGDKHVTLLTRDLDSRPTRREALGVKRWLRSKMHFHRIYDTNMDDFEAIPKELFRGKPCIVPFFAGLFGARSDSKPIVPSIQKMINNYPYKFAYGGEEKFLAEKILPIAKKKGVYTSIMKGHDEKQGSLFLNKKDKHEFSHLLPIPVDKNSMIKYQVHAEYRRSNSNTRTPVTASQFLKHFKNNRIILPK